jgi:nicotinamide-nucleotide amidase
VLRGGLVTYTVESKTALAGVPAELLAEVGPVAEPTARALAVGARQRCGATWGVGLTGVAGPEPHGGHPVGTVYLGVAGPDDLPVTVESLQLDGSRWEIRAAAVAAAVRALRHALARS